MSNKPYTLTFNVNQNSKLVFNAIINFNLWWAKDIYGKTDKLNNIFYYRHKENHFIQIQLIEIIPNKKLVYLILNNNFSFINDKNEWKNNKLIFEIINNKENTKVIFTHEGLNKNYECYNICFNAWKNYINKSLYNLITTGKGEPNELDTDINNINQFEVWKKNLK